MQWHLLMGRQQNLFEKHDENLLNALNEHLLFQNQNETFSSHYEIFEIISTTLEMKKKRVKYSSCNCLLIILDSEESYFWNLMMKKENTLLGLGNMVIILDVNTF